MECNPIQLIRVRFVNLEKARTVSLPLRIAKIARGIPPTKQAILKPVIRFTMGLDRKLVLLEIFTWYQKIPTKTYIV
jgi:hypothetical protein